MVVLSSLAVAIFAIEGMAWMSHDATGLSRYAARPLSPWILWKRIQWFGLIRIPMTLLYSSPLAVVPLFLIEGNRLLPLLTLALCLASLFALRTLLVAGIVSDTSCSFLPSWVGKAIIVLQVFLGMALPLLCVAASLPLDGSAFLALIRQGALQAGSLSLFGMAAGVWCFASRPPKESG